jgi:hypothetical protein
LIMQSIKTKIIKSAKCSAPVRAEHKRFMLINNRIIFTRGVKKDYI